MIDGSQFTTRTALADYAVQLLNEATSFIATDVLPPKYVEKSESKKYQYDTAMIKEVETEADSKAEANEVDYGVFTSNLTTKPHKLKGQVDPKDAANADAAVRDMKYDQSQNIMQRLLIKMERKMVALVLDATNYPSALTSTLAAGFTWLDAAGDPENDSIVAAEAVENSCLKAPNAAAMSGTTFRRLKTSPAFRERIKYTNGGPVPADAIKAFLGVEHLFICGAKYDSAVQGATSTKGDIWDDSVLFFVHNPNPALKQVSFGHTWMRKDFYSFEWEDQKRGSADGRIQWVEQGLEYVQGPGMVVSSADNDFAAGYLLKNVI